MGKSMSITGFNFTIILIILNTLSGCSIYDENYMMRVATPPEYEEINKYVEEWKEAKPKVERISIIEHDLALMIEEVDKLSMLKNEPTEQVLDYAKSADGNRAHIPQLPYEATNVDLTGQYFAAHLAFFLKEDSARGGWLVLKKRYPEVLNGLTPVVQKVIRNQQTIYSLRVGPFDGEVGAKEICSVFNHYKYICKQANFSGNAI